MSDRIGSTEVAEEEVDGWELYTEPVTGISFTSNVFLRFKTGVEYEPCIKFTRATTV